jgi:hypothetical protein
LFATDYRRNRVLTRDSLHYRRANDLGDGAGRRTWVQVGFNQEGDAGPIDHVWTAELDYNFHETPQLGDAVIVRGFERTVEAGRVNEDGSIDFVTRFEGTGASVPLEVAGRAWLAEGCCS